MKLEEFASKQAEKAQENFTRRLNEVSELSPKLAEHRDVLNGYLKYEGLDKPNESGLPCVSLDPFVHNAMLWYPRQTVRMIIDKMPDYLQEYADAHPLPSPIAFLDRHVRRNKVFNFLVTYLCPSHSLDYNRSRSCRIALANINRIKACLNDECEGNYNVNLNNLSRYFHFTHILTPERTTEFTTLLRDHFTELIRINHNQFKGFKRMARK